MAKRITLGKREREKLKQTKRQDKQKKKEEPMSGRVEYFTASKGYGFIKDAAGSEKYFFHITNAPAGIAEGDRVTFELERGTRGMNAVRIVISNK